MEAHSSWFVIINPSAGNGSALKQWPNIKSLLSTNNFNFQFAFTNYPEHATILVLKAVKIGFRKIICIGGDGTLHHIVNGLMRQKVVASSAIPIGVIPIGTGNDWTKTYNIPKKIDIAIQLIKRNTIRVQDIGKIEFLDANKQAVYFNNLAGIGFDGLVAKKAEKLKCFGRFSYLIAACQALLTSKNFEVEIVYKNRCITTKSLMVLIGLGRFSGGGMCLTNTPDPSDGLFDISNVINFKILDFILNLPKLYNGRIDKAKKVNTFKTDWLLIRIKNDLNNLYLQTDGEVLVAENLSITLLKNAFSFYC